MSVDVVTGDQLGNTNMEYDISHTSSTATHEDQCVRDGDTSIQQELQQDEDIPHQVEEEQLTSATMNMQQLPEDTVEPADLNNIDPRYIVTLDKKRQARLDGTKRPSKKVKGDRGAESSKKGKGSRSCILF